MMCNNLNLLFELSIWIILWINDKIENKTIAVSIRCRIAMLFKP